MQHDNIENKMGCFLGLAIGDAIGATLEFMNRDTLEEVVDMIGGGVHDLEPGQWTDDTSMALCLAYSLSEKGYDLDDQLAKYLKWYEKGYCSSKQYCFDIGVTTKLALLDYKKKKITEAVYSEHSAGNGALMRLAPLPIYFSFNVNERDSLLRMVHYVKKSSRTTHNNIISDDCCAYFSIILNKAFNHVEKEKLIHLEDFERNILNIQSSEIKPIIDDHIFLTQERHQIKSTGYVIDSLNAALWCFYQTDNFKDAVLKATNLAGDSDTIAAICGMLAGAYYGINQIPEEWIMKTYQFKDILKLTTHLYIK